MATELVQGGHVRINRITITKTSHPVKPDDVLTLAIHSDVKIIKILAAAERRGPASEARLLYQDLGALPAAEKMGA